jgi:hypothetical protein
MNWCESGVSHSYNSLKISESRWIKIQLLARGQPGGRVESDSFHFFEKITAPFKHQGLNPRRFTPQKENTRSPSNQVPELIGW